MDHYFSLLFIIISVVNIIICSIIVFSFLQILNKEFKSQGYSVPTGTAPKPMLWFMSYFDEKVKAVYPSLGKVQFKILANYFFSFFQILNKEFKSQGYCIPTGTAPKPMLWLISHFDDKVKAVYPSLGKVHFHEFRHIKMHCQQ